MEKDVVSKLIDSKFPPVDYSYNPKKDIGPVDQFGYVDLRAAYVNGTMPGDVAFSESDFNGVEEPASLLGKSSDVFDSIRKAQYVKFTEGRIAAEKAAAEAQASAASSSASE